MTTLVINQNTELCSWPTVGWGLRRKCPHCFIMRSGIAFPVVKGSPQMPLIFQPVLAGYFHSSPGQTQKLIVSEDSQAPSSVYNVLGVTWVSTFWRTYGHNLEKEMATHSSILVWKISCTVEPDGLRSLGLQRVGHDWVTNTNKYIIRCLA